MGNVIAFDKYREDSADILMPHFVDTFCPYCDGEDGAGWTDTSVWELVDSTEDHEHMLYKCWTCNHLWTERHTGNGHIHIDATLEEQDSLSLAD